MIILHLVPFFPSSLLPSPLHGCERESARKVAAEYSIAITIMSKYNGALNASLAAKQEY